MCKGEEYDEGCNMKDYWKSEEDNGGVDRNCGIGKKGG